MTAASALFVQILKDLQKARANPELVLAVEAVTQLVGDAHWREQEITNHLEILRRENAALHEQLRESREAFRKSAEEHYTFERSLLEKIAELEGRK